MTLHDAIAEARSIGLTRAQLRYLRAVRDATDSGLPTTHREVAAALGVAVGGVYQMLTRLRRDGLVTFDRGRTRTIRCTQRGLDAASLDATAVPARRGHRQDLAIAAGGDGYASDHGG